MTSIKQSHAHRSMQGSTWNLRMISSNYKTTFFNTINKTKQVSVCTITPPSVFNHKYKVILMMFFYFEDIGEVNGIQLHFSIGIHTFAQFQIVLQFGYNGAISMYVTFGTNYVKYHLFMLMIPLHAKLILSNMLD